MSKILWKSWLVSQAVVGGAIAISAGGAVGQTLTPITVNRSPTAIAQATSSDTSSLNQLLQYGREGRKKPRGQVTSVSQLRDVQPTDWAFQALQSLVERYGCIAGYPDGTFRGNRALTRFEFAAGLNACLDRINELIAAATANLLTRQDLTTLQRLQEEFAAELATLRGRVDALEARTAELEANQFSTTTKLRGEAIFAITDAWGGGEFYPRNQTAFQSRVRLNFNTSFTGSDLLLTRLQVGNTNDFNFQDVGGIGLQTHQFGGETGNIFELDTLAYFFNVGDRITITVAANNGQFDDVTPTLNPFLEDFDGGNGAVSTLAQRNPIYRIGGGPGAAVNFNIGEIRFPIGLGAANITAAYFADNGNDPTEGNGLFNGDYAALGQLTLTPFNRLSIGLTYVHGYHTRGNAIFDNGGGEGVVGTRFTSVLLDGLRGAITDSYGGELSWQLSDKFVISGWFTFTDVLGVDGTDAEIWTYALGVSFPDLFGEGNILGIFGGVPPYLGDIDGRAIPNATPVHVEAFYKLKLSDNISVTPSVMWISNPNQGAPLFTSEGNDDIVIGTIRTTFTF